MRLTILVGLADSVLKIQKIKSAELCPWRDPPPGTSVSSLAPLPHPDRPAATAAGRAAGFARLRSGLFRAAASLMLAVAALLVVPGGASAQDNSVRDSWSLLPSGLEVGDQFRLIFTTSTTRNGSSSDIEVYNTFVQNRAAAGLTDIRSYSSQFRVVGSTETVDARDNTGTTGTGVPIYWLNGAKVADNYADFYDDSWDNYTEKNESGQAGRSPVLTGSLENGRVDSSYPLGGASEIRLGSVFSSVSGGPIQSNDRADRSQRYALYGLSPVITVGAGPAITDVSVTSRPADGTDTFKAGEQVEITITFDEPVEVQNAGVDGADVHIEVSVGPVPSGGFLQRDADFLRQDHPSQLIFAFEVLSGLVDGNGFCIGEICDRDNIVLDGTAAIVATSDGATANTAYAAKRTSWKIDPDTEGLTGGVCDRLPAVRDALVAAVSAATTCANVNQTRLGSIRNLDLAGFGHRCAAQGRFSGTLRAALARLVGQLARLSAVQLVRGRHRHADRT